MEKNVIRFAIGPWKNHYSEVWRIWSYKNDIYLGATSLLKCLKFSLHQSGICRLAYVAENYEKLKKQKKAPQNDRCILEWNRGQLNENEIKQILDIHFPLNILHHNVAPKVKAKKKLIKIQPDNESVGNNDSLTLQLLFHSIHPEEDRFIQSLARQKLAPFIYFELEDAYISFAFKYSKILPIELKGDHRKMMENAIVSVVKHYNLEIGESKEKLSMLDINGNTSPPSLVCINNIKITKNSEKNYGISIDEIE